MVWACMQSQWKGKDYNCLSFPEGAETESYSLLYNVFSEPDFLSPRTTIVSGIENYPSTCMSWCSDDLALLLPRLDL